MIQSMYILGKERIMSLLNGLIDKRSWNNSSIGHVCEMEECGKIIENVISG